MPNGLSVQFSDTKTDWLPNLASSALKYKYNVQMITITGSATKYWQLNSWDRFMLPKPFGRINIVVSPPMEINTPPANNEEEVKLLSDFINHYQEEVDRMTGKI